MKKLNIFFALVIVLVVTSNVGCKKLTDPKSLGSFNVTADKQSYNLNDTVVFTISDKADIITFYDGQPGMNFNFRNRYYGKGINILKFQDSVAQGNKSNLGDSLHLFIITNLKSNDSTGIANATKFDITNLVQWPTSTSKGWVSSGNIDISQFNNYDSIYIAFQFLGNKSTLTAQRKFVIKSFTLSNLQLPDSSFTPLFFPAYTSGQNIVSDTLPNFLNTGWSQVDMNIRRYDTTPSNVVTNYGAWNVADYGYTSTTTPFIFSGKKCNSSGIVVTANYPITFDPGNNPKTNKFNYEGWLITSPVNLNMVRHDFPTAIIKDAANTVSKGFKFMYANGFATYSLPIDQTFVSGKTYDMAFVAQNLNINEAKEVIKHVMIKIN